MRPARRPQFGQHFLRDLRFRQRIAASLALAPDELVVEIGPGHGEMTELLAKRARLVVAIEIDARLVATLREKLKQNAGIEILQADFLNTDLADLCRCHARPQCFVFGNLPYYITSPILHHLFSFAACIRGMALLMQREVAERLVAQPGRRAYGYLTVLTRFYTQPRIVLDAPPGAFSPPPKVDSALVEFRMVSKFANWTSAGTQPFLEFVQRCFAQKRKNLKNNLASTFPQTAIGQAMAKEEISLSARAEQLTVEQFAGLFRRLHEGEW